MVAGNNINYEKVISNIFDWMKKENFYGYDPYDGCNTKYKWLKQTKAQRVFLVYFNKFSPVNFRPLLGVQKNINFQALANIILALNNLGWIEKEKDLIEDFINIFLKNSLINKYGYHCWNGNNVYVQTLKKLQTPYTPGVIGTEIIGRAIFEYAKKFGVEKKYAEILKSIRNFFIDKLFNTYNGHFFIRYNPDTPVYSFNFNASIISAVFVLNINNYFNEVKGTQQAIKCIEEVISYQKPDGHWNYSINLLDNTEKKQIDFHQGFICDAIHDYLKLFPNDSKAKTAYLKGLEFYYKEQFTDKGMGYYRYPKKWPANIHNQAQGIITLSKALSWDTKWDEPILKITNWTFKNMYNNKKGCFYFLKYPLLTTKIPYLRWNQSFMMKALSIAYNSLR